MLTIEALTYRIQERLLFDGASLVLPDGSKTGLVGRNGSGKTTLFRLIRGELAPESGTIDINRRARIGWVAQEVRAGEMSVLDMVMAADAERARLVEEAETATDAHRIAEIHTRLAEIDAHTAEARASAILKGLGFSPEAQRRPTQELSGGWRMRVALAGLLFSQPDLLLLDEPSNYLDLEGTLWLQKYLASYPYTVLLVSHDRDLLNNAVTSIAHLHQGRLAFYRGNYDGFEQARRMQMELANKTREKTLERIAHLQSFVDRFRYKASKARQAQARMKMIERLKPPAAMFDETAIPFRFPPPSKATASPMIALEKVAVGYDSGPVLSRISARIDPDDRIALVGVNGNGKSTFAKLLAGDLKPMGGEMRRAKNLEVAYFAQHQMEKLEPNLTPLEHIIPLTPYDTEAKRRSRTAQMGLAASRMDTPARDLSGGERARLLMGLVTFSGPNFLILDEPTNHLDIDSRDALVEALNAYEGAVLIISHDRHLLEATVNDIWIAQNGTIERFDDDFSGYQRMLLANGRERPAKSTMAPRSRDSRKAVRQDLAQKRAEIAPLRKSIREAEAKIARLKTEIEKIEAALADPKIYDGAPDQIIALGKDKARYADEIEKMEESWLDLSAALEAAERALA